MDKIWHELYNIAKKQIKSCEITPFIEYGNNSCAILAGNNKIYYGTSITSNTLINSSAEKSAITSMLTDHEQVIKKMVILNELEEVIPPCEDCLDFILELCNDYDDLEVLIDLDKEKIKTLHELLPDWWGTYRIKKK